MSPYTFPKVCLHNFPSLYSLLNTPVAAASARLKKCLKSRSTMLEEKLGICLKIRQGDSKHGFKKPDQESQ